jgi:hypothetical protein
MIRIMMLALCLLMNLALQCRTPSPELWSDLIVLLIAAFWSTKLYIHTYTDKYKRIYIYIYINTHTQTECN